jgi:hypothetical protein
MAVLGHLDRMGSLSIADLARHEQVKHQSMTRTVNLLHARGMSRWLRMSRTDAGSS